MIPTSREILSLPGDIIYVWRVVSLPPKFVCSSTGMPPFSMGFELGSTGASYIVTGIASNSTGTTSLLGMKMLASNSASSRSPKTCSVQVTHVVSNSSET